MFGRTSPRARRCVCALSKLSRVIARWKGLHEACLKAQTWEISGSKGGGGNKHTLPSGRWPRTSSSDSGPVHAPLYQDEEHAQLSCGVWQEVLEEETDRLHAENLLWRCINSFIHFGQKWSSYFIKWLKAWSLLQHWCCKSDCKVLCCAGVTFLKYVSHTRSSLSSIICRIAYYIMHFWILALFNLHIWFPSLKQGRDPQSST